jgi:hypothetical protein
VSKLGEGDAISVERGGRRIVVWRENDGLRGQIGLTLRVSGGDLYFGSTPLPDLLGSALGLHHLRMRVAVVRE